MSDDTVLLYGSTELPADDCKEQHLDVIIQAQNRIVLLQQIVNPE